MSHKAKLLDIFEKNYKFLFRIVYAIVKDADSTLDILQETFLKAFVQDVLPKSDEDLLKWLIVISKNTAKTHVKRDRRCEPLENLQVESDDFEFFDSLLDDLRSEIEAVPAELFDCLMLNIMEDVPLLELSRQTKISYERLRYWKKVLVRELSKWIKKNMA